MRKILEIVAVGMLSLTWGWTANALFGAHPLPARIPTHFDLAGRPDRWGQPEMLWLLPVVSAVIYALMTLVARYPGAFNFPMRTTAVSRPKLEAIALDMISWLKAEVVCLFAWIQYETIQFARHGRGGLTKLFMPLVLVAVFGTIAWHIAAMRRAGRV